MSNGNESGVLLNSDSKEKQDGEATTAEERQQQRRARPERIAIMLETSSNVTEASNQGMDDCNNQMRLNQQQQRLLVN